MIADEARDSSPLTKRAKLDGSPDSLGITLSEADVGISEYIFEKNSGFKGTLKGRHVMQIR